MQLNALYRLGRAGIAGKEGGEVIDLCTSSCWVFAANAAIHMSSIMRRRAMG
jgi:hypothetical protein